jgi:hypothetical protein
MHLQVYTIRWICDFCGKKTVLSTTHRGKKPEGWGTKEVVGFGLTNSSKELDSCDECTPKAVAYAANGAFSLV